MSTTFLKYFHNKSQVISCYWFKFEPNTKITFLPPTITTNNNLPLKICYKNIVKIQFLFGFGRGETMKHEHGIA